MRAQQPRQALASVAMPRGIARPGKVRAARDACTQPVNNRRNTARAAELPWQGCSLAAVFTAGEAPSWQRSIFLAGKPMAAWAMQLIRSLGLSPPSLPRDNTVDVAAARWRLRPCLHSGGCQSLGPRRTSTQPEIRLQRPDQARAQLPSRHRLDGAPREPAMQVSTHVPP